MISQTGFQCPIRQRGHSRVQTLRPFSLLVMRNLYKFHLDGLVVVHLCSHCRSAAAAAGTAWSRGSFLVWLELLNGSGDLCLGVGCCSCGHLPTHPPTHLPTNLTLSKLTKPIEKGRQEIEETPRHSKLTG